MAKFKNGNLRLKDNQRIQFGDNQDASIYHSGSSLIVKSGSNIQIRIDDNTVELNHAGVKQLETTATGIKLSAGSEVNEFTIDGTLTGDSDNAVPTEKAVKTYVDAKLGANVDSGSANSLAYYSDPTTIDAASLLSVDTSTGFLLLDTDGFVGMSPGATFTLFLNLLASSMVEMRLRDNPTAIPSCSCVEYFPELHSFSMAVSRSMLVNSW